MRSLLLTAAAFASITPLASAQYRNPTIPLQQSSVPQMNPNAGRMMIANPQQMGNGTVPGSTVFVPPRYVNNTGSTYIINNYNNGNNNPFGTPAGGFNGLTASSGQFYAVMGGPAATNPFIGNVAPIPQQWPSTLGGNRFNQQTSTPFNYYNFTNQPQYPYMLNAPTVVGQANGFFPNQPAAVAPPQPNNFGVQMVPGLNGFGNAK